VAGLITVAQSGVGDPTTGTDWALTAIAAIVIGGTRLSGGIGGMRSVVVGTFLISVLSNALTLYNVSPFWVPIVTGAIVIGAVAIVARSGRSIGSLVKSRQL
jgi:ribose/xylose/arabinose/galactoside ABC-type transport system permease subunit